MEHFKRKEEWKKVFFSSVFVPLCRSFKVDTIDVYRQVTHSMSIGVFYDKMTAKERPRLYNILSLEFSQNEAMCKLVSPPILVLELSFVHKLWPDRNDLINWDPELRQIVEVLEEHRRNKPEVALFCLCGMAGSYTDFHIDFGGSSVWYHIYQGKKIFYLIEPTVEYLNLFEKYQLTMLSIDVFQLVIHEGQTLMIPSGWIHAVYTPVDSLVFGGNFLHALNTPMQLRLYDMEQRLKKEIGTEDRFLFPHFELVNWYAARSFILEHLREANDEGNRADQYIMEAALALLPHLKEWMRRDKVI
uniref:JmjC domain-containing protein n=1 Tax=Angiostrongylus cantonensis TaxID=6313 RepID=A0A158P6J1_ANGCA